MTRFPISQIPRLTALATIRVYQWTLSFDHGWMKRFYPNGYCRFHPTCSMYGYDAIARFGVIKGGGMTLWRVARCNPFNKGGIDEVPPAPPKSTISNKTP